MMQRRRNSLLAPVRRAPSVRPILWYSSGGLLRIGFLPCRFATLAKIASTPVPAGGLHEIFLFAGFDIACPRVVVVAGLAFGVLVCAQLSKNRMSRRRDNS